MRVSSSVGSMEEPVDANLDDIRLEFRTVCVEGNRSSCKICRIRRERLILSSEVEVIILGLQGDIVGHRVFHTGTEHPSPAVECSADTAAIERGAVIFFLHPRPARLSVYERAIDSPTKPRSEGGHPWILVTASAETRAELCIIDVGCVEISFKADHELIELPVESELCAPEKTVLRDACSAAEREDLAEAEPSRGASVGQIGLRPAPTNVAADINAGPSEWPCDRHISNRRSRKRRWWKIGSESRRAQRQNAEAQRNNLFHGKVPKSANQPRTTVYAIELIMAVPHLQHRRVRYRVD
jgi:hypothetical protein